MGAVTLQELVLPIFSVPSDARISTEMLSAGRRRARVRLRILASEGSGRESWEAVNVVVQIQREISVTTAHQKSIIPLVSTPG